MPIAGNNHRERLIHSRNLSDIESNPLNAQRERASWRGWLIGLLAISGVSAAIPYADFVLRGTPLSHNAFPMIPVILILLLSAVMFWCRNIFGLSRQDLTLIYCMTSISYAIPGIGFWWAWSTGMTGAYFHASPENNWAEIIHPHLSAGFFPRDPVDPFDPAPRPIEWFYTGLPMGKTIPWLAWLGPYSRWCLVVMCMNGIWFSLATLLYSRWSRQERLPFPIAQIPAELIQLGKGGPGRRSFFQENRPLIGGIILTFTLQSWNSLHSYVSNVPEIPLRFENLHTKIFSEPPWRDIGGLDVNIFPSVIGLTYLLSMEVGFSLWFFYVLKLVLNFFFAGRVGAPALDEAYQAQGTGALLALSWFMAWMARRDLWHSLRQALGKEHWDDDDGWHPMWTWLLLAISIAGAIAWLLWAGVDWRWAVSILFLFMTVIAGLSRLIAGPAFVRHSFTISPCICFQ